jgi:hypothetical protein
MRAGAKHDASANVKNSVLPRTLQEAVLARILSLPVVFRCTETDTVGNARLNDWGDTQAGEIVSLTCE